MESKVIVAGALGAAAGVVQTAVLREYVDKAYPITNVEALGGFGKPSAAIGILLGAAGLGLGYYGMSGHKMTEINSVIAIDYGIAALTSGIISGLDPVQVDPAVCTKAGGFWYADEDGVSRCHQSASTTTTSPKVQTSQYRPAAMDINVLKQMSAEIQRLSAENASIRAQVQAPQVQAPQPIDGSVHSKQAEYGFMAIAPGQPTDRAKSFGFMANDDVGSLTKVQAMKQKYNFLG